MCSGRPGPGGVRGVGRLRGAGRPAALRPASGRPAASTTGRSPPPPPPRPSPPPRVSARLRRYTELHGGASCGERDPPSSHSAGAWKPASAGTPPHTAHRQVLRHRGNPGRCYEAHREARQRLVVHIRVDEGSLNRARCSQQPGVCSSRRCTCNFPAITGCLRSSRSPDISLSSVRFSKENASLFQIQDLYSGPETKRKSLAAG